MNNTEAEGEKRLDEMTTFVDKQPSGSVVFGFHATLQDWGHVANTEYALRSTKVVVNLMRMHVLQNTYN